MLTSSSRNYTISFNKLFGSGSSAFGSRELFGLCELSTQMNKWQFSKPEPGRIRTEVKLSGDSGDLIGAVCVRERAHASAWSSGTKAFRGELPFLWSKRNSKQMRWIKMMNGSHAGDTQEDYWADLHQICPGNQRWALIRGSLVSFFGPRVVFRRDPVRPDTPASQFVDVTFNFHSWKSA